MSGLRAGIQRRLLKELVESKAAGQAEGEHVRLEAVDEHDLDQWRAVLTPGSDSIFAGGTFHIAIQITAKYPIQPPRITFITPIFHPNIHPTSGEICLDVLKAEWSPAWTLHAACLAILVLLDNPDATSPLSCDAGNLIRAGDFRGYRSLAQLWVRLHAKSQ